MAAGAAAGRSGPAFCGGAIRPEVGLREESCAGCKDSGDRCAPRRQEDTNKEVSFCVTGAASRAVANDGDATKGVLAWASTRARIDADEQVQRAALLVVQQSRPGHLDEVDETPATPKAAFPWINQSRPAELFLPLSPHGGPRAISKVSVPEMISNSTVDTQLPEDVEKQVDELMISGSAQDADIDVEVVEVRTASKHSTRTGSKNSVQSQDADIDVEVVEVRTASKHSTRTGSKNSVQSQTHLPIDQSEACQSEASRPSGKGVLTRKSTRRLLAGRLHADNESLDEDTLDLVSFSGAEGLLRASRLTTVLSWGGHVFKHSAGSEETYALSEPVAKIDAFLSHNWCVPRYKKFFALVVHFNLWPAAVLVVAAAAVVAAIDAADKLPEWAFIEGAAGYQYQQGILNRLLCTPFYLLVLLTCRAAGKLLGYRGPTVFLDKTCINQVDPDLQRVGIQKLGAFLCSSASMVIIYTDVYLQRLWTVYEIASFLALHPLARMIVVPTSLPVALLVGLLFVWVSNAISVLLTVLVPAWNSMYTYRIAMLAGSYPLVWALRRAAHEREEMRARLANFCVADCVTCQEGDRAVVYGNIAALMKATEAISRDADDELALATFNHLVREKLPDAIVTSVGKVGLRYKHMVVVSANAVVPQFLDCFVGVHSVTSTREVLMQAFFYLMLMLILFPFWIIVMGRMGSCCLQLRGWKDRAFVIGVATLSAFMLVLGSALWDALVAWSRRSNAGVAILVTFAGLVVLTALAAYGGVPHRTKDEAEELN